MLSSYERILSFQPLILYAGIETKFISTQLNAHESNAHDHRHT